MEISLIEIADRLSLDIIGDFSINLTVDGISSLKESGERNISFIANLKYTKYLSKTKACAVIMDYSAIKEAVPETHRFVILDTKNPYIAFAKATHIFKDLRNSEEKKDLISSFVYHVDETATIGKNSLIYQGVFISPGAAIGNNCKIMSNAYIGKNVKIGNNVLIYPNVTVYDDSIIGNNCIIHAGSVVGSDGFGFARDKTGYVKIEHLGYAVLEDNVELGANVTVDRGVVDFTKIGEGTKIDNLVQVAHNVIIGKNCVIAAQGGIAGSTVIGDNAVIGGQVGIAGHITIGNNVMIAAQSGVHADVEDNQVLSGTPAFNIKEWRNAAVRFKKLPELFKRVKSLENELAKIDSKK